MSATKRLAPAWPVIEIFGPTVQGEGVDQGVAAHFIRFGGCDFRCTWCDTPYAVLPNEVRANSTKMNAEEVLFQIEQFETPVPWIILTGGNPALHDLRSLVDKLHEANFLVAVETQGSRWRDWMGEVDRLCVSPKPPSALQEYEWETVQKFLDEGLRHRDEEEREFEWLFVKIPIFESKDLDFAEDVRSQLSNALLYLSAGNDAGKTVGNPKRADHRGLTEIRSNLLDKSTWLVNEVQKRPTLLTHDVVIQSQYHVLLWGNAKGR